EKMKEEAMLNIYSITGELVMATELHLLEGAVSIDPTFSKGVYFIEIISGDFRSIQKLILE
ncbi:MAG: T9SS type A sorting domain-containing protein, partial [Chitinophagales bacterium]|nr:T9SS type A sorting domain-containing protein [Chitinophagales bacterium]